MPRATTSSASNTKAAPLRRPVKAFPTRFSGADDSFSAIGDDGDEEDENPFRDLLAAVSGGGPARRVGLARGMKSKAESRSVKRPRGGVGNRRVEETPSEERVARTTKILVPDTERVSRTSAVLPPETQRVPRTSRVLAPETPVEESVPRENEQGRTKRLRLETEELSTPSLPRHTRIYASTPSASSSTRQSEEQVSSPDVQGPSTSYFEQEPSIPEVIMMADQSHPQMQSQSQTQSETQLSSQSQSQSQNSIYLATTPTHSQPTSFAAAQARALITDNKYEDGWRRVRPVTYDLRPTGECWIWKEDPPVRSEVREYARFWGLVEEPREEVEDWPRD